MSKTDFHDADFVSRDASVNPFALLPGVSSRIAGLGGPAPAHDPTYVFHTDYIGVAPGRAEFFVRFEGLKAKRGTIALRVHMLAEEEGAAALLATSLRIQLNRLVAQGGAIAVPFDAFQGIRYALYGSLAGESDAEAKSLSIRIDRPAGVVADHVIVVDPRTSAFGRDAGVPTANLISLATPTLNEPVSQICTARQLRELVATDWAQRLGITETDDLDRWKAIYTIQVLARYGMLAPEAAGLALARADDPVIAEILRRDASVLVITTGPGEQGESRHPKLQVRTEPKPHPLPADVVNFDFAWSCDALGVSGSLSMAQSIMEDMFARLRPGGLMVHTFPYDVDEFEQTIEQGSHIRFRRRDVERLALTFISHGHEAAQFKIHASDAPVKMGSSGNRHAAYRYTMAGLVVRKAPSQL